MTRKLDVHVSKNYDTQDSHEYMSLRQLMGTAYRRPICTDGIASPPGAKRKQLGQCEYTL